MLMPDLYLPNKVDQVWQYSGMDSPDEARYFDHFCNFPHSVTYNYNSRGFRDAEWPSTTEDLQNSIWCVGDSFTVGLGSPLEHIWPQRLAHITGRRTINVSMDGASNQWISRTVKTIVQQVRPTSLVVMWSYAHRREMDSVIILRQRWQEMYNKYKKPEWPSVDYDNRHQLPAHMLKFIQDTAFGWDKISAEDLRIHYSGSTLAEDWSNYLACRAQVCDLAKLVEFAVPQFHGQLTSVSQLWAKVSQPGWPAAPSTVAELQALPDTVHKILRSCGVSETIEMSLQFDNSGVKLVPQLDLARDGHHFDLVTADWVAEQAHLLLRS